MGFSGFSLMKGVGGSSVQMSSNIAWKDQAQSSGHFTFSALFENSTGVCLATTSALLWNRNAYIAGITLLWSLLQCNFLCRQSVVLICGVRSCQIVLVSFINLLISTELPHSVSSQVWHVDHSTPLPSPGAVGDQWVSANTNSSEDTKCCYKTGKALAAARRSGPFSGESSL